ncbi:TonB-dependent receptor domain-containing protein [Hymenobacter jejuensis]|uniref:TonB-dependent receptor domain-containing protein n=1 Tax=Hymenobacter jejuensis TaxID=2502781 RepID=UPI001E4A3134|nr:TonB-dependent receptor [Hymenobacter jejuensis]
MKKLLFLLTLAGSSQIAFAQMPQVGSPAGPARPQMPAGAMPAAEGSGRITGTVVDAGTQKPVPFATVALINAATGKPIDGTAADDDGKFTLTKVPAGTYKLQYSFIGYKTIEKEGIVVTEKGGAFPQGTIQLASTSQQLKEVVVQGQRALITEKVDRTVYNAENDQTTRGGDATDVLKRVPALSVDLDGNVSLRGNQNVRVLINNKPSSIAASSIADALKQIPADQIKSVEVITSPSAKYDAEGSGGIINIITKKDNLQGKSLGVDVSGGTRGANLGLNGSYRVGKMAFSLGGFGRAGYNTPGSFSNDQRTYSILNNDLSTRTLRTRTTQEADTRQNQVFGRYNFGWDYDINKYNSISASVQYGLRNSVNYQDNLLSNTYLQNETQAASGSNRNVRTNDKSNNVDLSLGYTHTSETPQKEFSLLGVYSRNNRNNDFTSNILSEFGNANISTLAAPYRLRNLNDSYNQELTLQADYQTPIGTNQLLEFGGKDIMRKVNSTYTYLQSPGLDGEFEPLATGGTRGINLNNEFNYNQNVAAAYAAYTLSFLKSYTLKAGARYEYTTIDANFRTNDTTSIPSYGVLVPSLNLSRKLANGNVLKASFNRRIQRPSIQFLNPNLQASNPKSATKGEPQLRPEYTNNYELGYNTFLKSVSLNMSAFVRNTTGSIQPVRRPVTANEILAYSLSPDAILTSYANIGQENAYGVSLFANVNVGNKFTLSGGPDMYYATLRNNVSDVTLNARNEGWVVSGRAFGNYNFSKGWGVQAFGFMRGRQVQLQGYQGAFGIYSLSLKKDFAEKKGSIGFGAENFFTPNTRIRNEVNSALVSQNSTNVLNRMNFKININYRIGKLSVADQRPRRKKSVNNDDLKEGGDDASGGGLQGGGVQGGGAPAGGARPSGAPSGAGGQRTGSYPGTGAPSGVRPNAAPASGTVPASGTAPASNVAPASDSTAAPVAAPATDSTATPTTTPAMPAQPVVTPTQTGVPVPTSAPATTPAPVSTPVPTKPQP